MKFRVYLLIWILSAGQGLGSRSGVSPPSAEKILAHLDRARQGCIPMFKVDSMQRVLQIAQAACTDTQRGLYSSLFALLEDEEQPPTTTSKTVPSTGKGRGRKAASSASANSTSSNSYSSKHRSASNRSNLKEISDSSESSSEVRYPGLSFDPHFLQPIKVRET